MEIIDFILLIPFLTVLSLFFAKDMRQIRLFASVGMGIQLLQSFALLFMYLNERKNGATEAMLFQKDVTWYESLNIHYAVGVDGVSVAMILLTSIVIFAGIFVSWNVKDLSKEFFISLLVLGAGVFGFFVSLDLFTMFLFYEIAVIPMYLLIGIWGTGPKEYSAMKLTLMLMAGSAFLLFGILGIYFESGHTFNILELSQNLMSKDAQMLLAFWEPYSHSIPGRPMVTLRRLPLFQCSTQEY
jgi:NADH-quinone oxidoreductase subunit M